MSNYLKRRGIDLLGHIETDGFEFSPFGPPDEPGVYMIVGLMNFQNSAHSEKSLIRKYRPLLNRAWKNG